MKLSHIVFVSVVLASSGLCIGGQEHTSQTSEPTLFPATISKSYKTLPILGALSEYKELRKTLRYIYKSDRPGILDDWLKDRYPAEEIAERDAEVERHYKEMHEKSVAWRGLVEKKMGIKLAHSNLNDTADQSAWQPPVYANTTLVIPLGHRRLHWVWPSLESFLSSSVWPECLIIVTGLSEDESKDASQGTDNPPHHIDYVRWRVTAKYLMNDIMPVVGNRVDVKWAVFDKPGGAAAGRYFGALLARTPYVRYHDSDDFIGHSVIEFGSALITKHRNIEHVLNAYTGTYYDEEKNEAPPEVLAQLKATNAERSLANYQLAFDHLVDAYKTTRLPNITDLVEKFDLEKCRDEAFKPFINRNTHIDLGNPDGWPQMQFFQNCDRWREAIEAAEERAAAAGELTPEIQHREKLAKQWFDLHCSKSISPEYLTGCHNGWGYISRNVLISIPLVNPAYGEDSLFNFLVSHSGHLQVCTNTITGGVYTFYRASHDKEFMGRLLNPPEI